MLKEQFEGKTSRQISDIKIAAHEEELKKIANDKDYALHTEKGQDIKIETVGVGTLKKGKLIPGKGPLWVQVSVGGKYVNGDGWYGFVNPPVMVPDGTTKEVQLEDGKKIEVQNLKEDVREAAKLIIKEAVKWQP